ncbi:hypothetical protein Tco_0051987 [Tanacetum coccineum]
MHQQQPQQLPNQFTTSQPHSEQQSHHLELEDTEDEDEPVPTPTSKPSRGVRLKSKAKKNKEKEPPLEKQKRIRNAWTQDEKLLLAECFIQVSEDPKTGVIKGDTFLGPKSQNLQYSKLRKKDITERTKNMLTVKWTPMNASVLKFNQLVQETAVHSGENDDDHMSRVHTFSGSNPAAYQEFMAEQYELDRKAKMTVLERESEDRRRLIQSQRIAEDMRVLQIDTRGMDAADAAIINAQKARIRAAYPPPPN